MNEIAAWIAQDPLRMSLLKVVAELDLPDSWIGAGFVRNLVWDALHGYSVPTSLADIDVIYFDPSQTERAMDLDLEERLLRHAPSVKWQVRNQARMHVKNGDRPYISSSDAISKWPETATAVAARWAADGKVQILAPLGVDDLLGLKVRPTPHFTASASKRAFYQTRVKEKGWNQNWPKLKFEF